ncbi:MULTISPECIES: TetR family transcriptional regulator [Micromonospora]|uniref:TetR family transcriptional regulator n=1 Tax=Micromonospora TaxID=1873 RepID=UPI001374C08A|nr:MULTISPECIES: TetR family transcriptional regulator [unclassified Micromonospora]
MSSRQEVEAAAVELFLAHGFEQTTVDDIAAAAGIGRSTFFRYFRTKADILWLPFDDHLKHLTASLAERPLAEPLTTAIIRGVMQAMRESGDPRGVWLRRFVAQEEQALQELESVRWSRWAAVVADFAAKRLSGVRGELAAAMLGGATQALIRSMMRRRAERDMRTETVLDEIERELHVTLDPLQAWLEQIGS